MLRKLPFRSATVAFALVTAVLLPARGTDAADVRTDFDNDGKTDVTVFRPSTGEWFVRQSSTGLTTYTVTQWGLPGDIAAPGDYDGDGKPDYAIVRRSVPWTLPGQPNEWFILLSTTSYTAYLHYYFGTANDIPVPADYDGDAKTDIAIYRPSDGIWHVLRSSFPPATRYLAYSGMTGTRGITDYPVPADYDGDGKADFAVYRRTEGKWYFRLTTTALNPVTSLTFGSGIDRPVPGDYDGDGKTDLAVFRPATGVWSIQPSAGGAQINRQWGLPGDVPEPGDYDGDGKTDVGVYRPVTGVWYVRNSSTAFVTQFSTQWGLPGDVPAPNVVVTSAIARLGAMTDLTRATDFDGDGRSDITIFRASSSTFWDPGSSGVWYSLRSSSGYVSLATYDWGLAGDVLVSSDFDADGITEPIVWRPSDASWYFRSLPPFMSGFFGEPLVLHYGSPGDVPTPGDYNGDGMSEAAFLRPSFGLVTYGSGFCSSAACRPLAAGDVSVPGDYDGDGRTDAAIFRPSAGNWSIVPWATKIPMTVTWGTTGDIPVAADYDGDGAADVAYFRPSTNTFAILTSSSGYTVSQSYSLGLSGDVPVQGDYDGDGLADVAIYRPSTGDWFIRTSSSNFATTLHYQFGLVGDIPVGGKG